MHEQAQNNNKRCKIMSQAAPTSLLLVHDGNISNRNQARALGLNMELHFKSVQEINILQQPEPKASSNQQLIIGCGHKASRYVCKFTGQSNTKTVQILHPRFPFQSSTAMFDYLVVPEHDCERYWFELDLDPKKVVKIHGSLGWNLDYFSLLRYRQRARARHPTKKTLVVLMGGSLLHPELFRELEEQQDLHVEYITSRRTKQLDMLHASGANNLDYREALACGDYFAVDADSISMVTDALTVMSERNIPTPLYLFSTPPHAKHVRFISQLSLQHSPNLFERLETVKQITLNARTSTTAAHQLIHFPNEAQRVGALLRRLLKLL